MLLYPIENANRGMTKYAREGTVAKRHPAVSKVDLELNKMIPPLEAPVVPQCRKGTF
jgi:hypothetical protein